MGMAYVNPVALIPDIVVKGNAFVSPDVIATEALTLLEDELVKYTLGRGTFHVLPKHADFGDDDYIEIGNAPSITFTIEEGRLK